MKILLVLSVFLAGKGTLFLYWYDQISDQCADAGFAWESSGKLLLIAASLILLTLVIIYFFRGWKNRATHTAPRARDARPPPHLQKHVAASPLFLL